MLCVLRASNSSPKQRGSSQLQQWEVRLSCWLYWERDSAACKVSALGSDLCFLNAPLDRSGSVWGPAKVCRVLLGDGSDEENIPTHSGGGRGQNYVIVRRRAKGASSAPAAERQKTAARSPKVRSEAPPISRSVPGVGQGSKLPRAPGRREGCGEGSAPLFVFRSEDPLGRTHPEKGGAASERRWGPAERDTPERGSRGGGGKRGGAIRAGQRRPPPAPRGAFPGSELGALPARSGAAMGSRLSRQSSLEDESSGAEEPSGRADFHLSSLLLNPQKLPGVLRKASPAPYVRRVGWLREIQATIREHKREHAVHILRLLRKVKAADGAGRLRATKGPGRCGAGAVRGRARLFVPPFGLGTPPVVRCHLPFPARGLRL